MKKMLIGATVLGVLLFPGLVFAAFDDVSLATTNTVISVGGFNLTVSGSNASVESLVVNASNFVVGLPAGSALTVSSADQKDFDVSFSGTGGSKSTTCGGAASTLVLTSTGAATAAVTPTGTCSSGGGQSYTYGCTNPAATNYNPLANADNGSCVLPSSGGGGGGGGATPATPAIPATPATPASSTTPAIPATPATPATPAIPASATERQALIANIMAQIALLKAEIKAKIATAPSASAVANANVNASFKRDLTVGTTGNDVQALQVWLNTHGYAIASSGPGSSGNETPTFGGLTRAALVKFQKANGITPAVGYFGPKTRAALSAQ